VSAFLDSADSLEQKDIMTSSIGPFGDANETCLVFSVRVLLVALSLRSVAFDFRVKAKAHHRPFVGQNLPHPFFADIMVGRFYFEPTHHWLSARFGKVFV